MQNDIVVDINEEIEGELTAADYSGLAVGSRDWTVETIISQIRKGNIDLNPAYQRRNAWNDSKRSRFIESLILNVPIPQIVLAEHQREEDKYFVLDGKQRLMTLASLAPENQYRQNWTAERLLGLDRLDYLNGKTLDEFAESDDFASERRRLENASIRCSFITKYRNEDVLYDLFYRINSGAVPLSGQELRQVLHKGPFAKYLFDYTNELRPLHAVLGLDEPDNRLADVEITLRSIAEYMGVVRYSGNLKQYLDETTQVLNAGWREHEQRVKDSLASFDESILRLGELFGDPLQVGRRYVGDVLERRFNRALFEAEVFYGRFITADLVADKAIAFRPEFKSLCNNAEFRVSIESTTKRLDRFKARFDAIRDLVNDVFELTLVNKPITSE